MPEQTIDLQRSALCTSKKFFCREHLDAADSSFKSEAQGRSHSKLDDNGFSEKKEHEPRVVLSRKR